MILPVEGAGPCPQGLMRAGHTVDDPQVSHNGLWRREAMYFKASRPLSTIHSAYYYDYRSIFI